MERKAQLTVIVIVGIVLVIIFGIVFWLRGALVQENPGGDDSHVQEFKRSVDVFVTGCLELVGKDAIKRIGEQGGDLYDVTCENNDCNDLGNVRWVERGLGTVPPGTIGVDFLPHVCDARTCYVSYGIMRNRAPPTTYGYDDWQYPHPDYDFSKPNDPNYLFLAYYGDNALRKLCDWEGPNTRDPSRKVMIPCDLYVFDTVYPAYVRNYSMQEQIAFYVEEHVGECAVLEPFIKQGYDFNVGEPDMTVVFGESDVSFSLEYPLVWARADAGGRNASKTRSVSFTKTLPIRLKRVVEFAHRLIEEDTTRLDFNLTVDTDGNPTPGNMYSQVAGWDASLRFKKVKNACGGCTGPVHSADGGIALCPTPGGCSPAYDDIIEIRDGASLIDGKPFSFNFAVQNRRPVLDKITQVQAGTTRQISALVEPKWCVSPFALHIRAKDPDDEDELKVRVFSPSGSLNWNAFLKYNCQSQPWAVCQNELFNQVGWTPHMSPTFPNFEYRASAFPVLTYLDVLPGTIAYHPFVDGDVVLTAPIDAVNFMSSLKDVRVVVEDEDSLMDLQDFNYQCCTLTGLPPQQSCYGNLLVDGT